MNRVMVIGVSPGVGKSTFARMLGELTGMEVTHLDRHYWKPGWVEAPAEEFSAAQHEIVKRDRWIIEGNYTSTIDIREPHADTVIYLELPMRICLYRVVKRRIQYRGKTREDLTPGCPEKIDWAFLKFIVTTYSRRKKNMLKRLQRYANEGKTVHYLNSAAQIEGFLSTFKGGKGE
ncbi:topology modulation protein [Sporosarcina sp. ACRSL]|uniref:topology modulation protein n=1 Tax=Sporosarcina sp. ACRSL TaxID=2918215 RepID=UPI001EF57CB6|nr:topology modulation protein [Sporosarcina sp. ACRSL]MCG7343759.1 topology modulation protein [Sporosarcina sp. ACRSL]